MSALSPPPGPVVLVTAAGNAQGSRVASAALACAGAEVDRAVLLIEFDGRPPRQTLLSSRAARDLEERLAVHLPGARVAARGQICQLSLSADAEGLAAASAAATVARDAGSVLHVPPGFLQAALAGTGGPGPSAALLRADLERDRALTALAVRDLLGRGLRVAVLKRALGWVPARRALFGALPAEGPGGLPARLRARLGLGA